MMKHGLTCYYVWVTNVNRICKQTYCDYKLCILRDHFQGPHTGCAAMKRMWSVRGLGTGAPTINKI